MKAAAQLPNSAAGVGSQLEFLSHALTHGGTTIEIADSDLGIQRPRIEQSPTARRILPA
jgi:hypothetical protein